MSGFSAEWLTLREPYDRSARSPAVLSAVVAGLGGTPDIGIIDLACGTGSTFRALAPRLAARQRWRLIDHDPALLAVAAAMQAPSNAAITTAAVDLAADVAAALATAADLVTTSALLDLVSEDWLARLAAAIGARRLPFYAALSYDGRIELGPPDPFDAAIIGAVNAHQRTDKGFGPALGPDAASIATGHFRAIGYAVTEDRSDWTMSGDDRAIQHELLSGWAHAARELGTLAAAEIDGWLMRRRASVDAGRSSMRVGHIDFFATPTGTR